MIIYKITNILNGKVYIGQTITSLEERWKNHRSSSSGCLAIKSAINKYGIENFKIEQIDQANDLEELNKKEGEWIDKLDAMSPNGYNLKTGGDQPRLCGESLRKSSASKKGMKAWNKGLDKSDARVAKYTRYGNETHAFGKIGYRKGKQASEKTRKKISEAVKGRRLSEETRKKMSEAHVKHAIFCITNQISYNSIMDACRSLNLNPGNVYQVLKGRALATKGYSFRYVEKING